MFHGGSIYFLKIKMIDLITYTLSGQRKMFPAFQVGVEFFWPVSRWNLYFPKIDINFWTYLKTEGVITSCQFWGIFKKPTYDFRAFQDVRGFCHLKELLHTVYSDKSRNSPALASSFWSQRSVDIFHDLSGWIRKKWMSETQGRWNPGIFENTRKSKVDYFKSFKMV